MQSERILGLMDDVMRRVRRIVLTVGLLTVVAWLLAGFLAVGILDWFLWLPASVRLVLTSVLLVIVGYVALTRLVRPLGAPLRRVTVATRLEGRFGVFGNRLSSSVQFVENPPAGSRDMMDEVVRRTEVILDRFDTKRIYSRRILWRHGTGALVPAIFLALITAFVPYWPATALARLVLPFQQVRWPRAVEIITGPVLNVKAPLGGSHTAEIQIGRGDRPNLRAFIHTRNPRGRKDVFPMQRGADGVYRWTFDGLADDLQYWYEAGDDSTEQRRGLIRVVPRPALESVRLEVRLPDYVGGAYEVALPAGGGRADVLAGSRVRLRATVSKPIEQDRTGSPEAWLLAGPSETIAMRFADETHRIVQANLMVREPIRVQISVEDRDGFKNEPTGEYELIPRADRPPTMAVLEPTTSLEVIPDGQVEILLALSDDVRLQELWLRATRVGTDENLPPIDLGKALRREVAASGPATDGSAPDRPATDKRQVRFTWELRALGLKPGDAVTYRLEVSDNYGLDDSEAHTTRSAPLLLKVLSRARFADRLQVEFQLLRARLRELLDVQETLEDTVQRVRTDRKTGQALDREALDSLGQVSAAQNQLAARTGHISTEFDRVLDRMRRNQYGDETAEQDTEKIAYDLRRLAEGAMTEAGRNAEDVQRTESPEEQDELLSGLSGSQRLSLDTLERLLQRLQRWGSFQEMVRKTQDVLDRQQELTRGTANLHRRTLGKPSESLNEEERKLSARLSRRQGRLANEADELVSRMSEMAGTTRGNEPATSESLRSAERAARAGNLSRRLQEAAEGIRRNRVSRALTEQKASEVILSKMLARLRKRQSRQLAELARRTEQAEDLVRYLIEQQVQLRESTHAASEDSAASERWTPLAREQEALEGNTRQLSKDLFRTLDTAKPARRIRSAAGKMQSAASRLAEGNADAAEETQSAAIDRLNEALEALREVRDRAETELAKQAVLALRHRLIEVYDTEREVADECAKLLEILKERGRLRRAETRRLTSMARTQKQLRERMDGILKQVEQVVVHKWLFERIARDITSAGQRMEQRLIDRETGEVLDRIIASLRRVIDTLDVSDVQPEDQFAAGEQGGGAGGSAAGIKPVPTIAELKLLRALQTDINERTTGLHREGSSDGQSEKLLRRMRELAGEQREVRELTGKLFERQQ